MIFSLAVILSLPSLLCAHGVSGKIDTGGVVVTTQYDTGEPMSYARVKISAPGAKITFQSGRTDRNGQFCFFPDTLGEWKVVVDDEIGHRLEVKAPVDETMNLKTDLDTGRSESNLARYEKALMGISIIFGFFGCLLGWKGYKRESKDDNRFKINLRPVGVVRSRIREPSLVAGADDLEQKKSDGPAWERERKLRDLVSEIVIDSRLEGILDGIEDFSHIFVLYWPHQIPDEKRKLIKVHPMGQKDLPLMGIFATCSPARPNPVLITAVRFLERHENVLKVQGLEAIDGSPIIDLKPYNPNYYLIKNAKLPDWMMKITRESEKD